MKHSDIGKAVVLFILLLFCPPGCAAPGQGRTRGRTPLDMNSAAIVTGPSAVDQMADGQHMMQLNTVLTRFSELPSHLDVIDIRSWTVCDHADAAGIHYSDYRAVWDSSMGGARFGHWERSGEHAHLWQDATVVLRYNNTWWNSIALEVRFKDGTAAYLPVSSTPNVSEQEVTRTVFALCPNLRNPRGSASGGMGRVYFYRGDDPRGIQPSIAISLDGVLVGWLPRGDSHLYLEEPAGSHRLGWQTNFDPDKVASIGTGAVGFMEATTLTVAAGDTRYLRLSVSPGVANKVEMTEADEQSASRIIDWHRTSGEQPQP